MSRHPYSPAGVAHRPTILCDGCGSLAQTCWWGTARLTVWRPRWSCARVCLVNLVVGLGVLASRPVTGLPWWLAAVGILVANGGIGLYGMELVEVPLEEAGL
jgi:hypothetical protein